MKTEIYKGIEIQIKSVIADVCIANVMTRKVNLDKSNHCVSVDAAVVSLQGTKKMIKNEINRYIRNGWIVK